MKKIITQLVNLTILKKMLIAVVMAIVIAILFPNVGTFIKPWGDIILRLIKMIIVPLIFFSIAKAVIDIKDATKAASLGVGSFLMYTLTTCLATCWALLVSIPLFNVITLPDLSHFNTKNIDQIVSNVTEYGGFLDAIFKIVPNNLLSAFVNGDTLSVIFFAVVVGFLVLKMINSQEFAAQGKILEQLIHSCSTLIYQFVNVVVSIMPFAVFAYLTWMISAQDPTLIIALGKMIIIGFSVLILHTILTYGGLLLMSGLNIMTFFKKFFPVQLFAFTTASSAATIPLNERRLIKKLGVSKATSGFVVPFGATVNMDGTAICQVVYALFIAQLYGIELGFSSYATLAIMSSVISIGVAAVPSASLVTLGVVLGIVGIPIEGIGIVIATDRLLDMARTTVNVTGDGVVSVVMDKMLGRFNKELYNQ